MEGWKVGRELKIGKMIKLENAGAGGLEKKLRLGIAGGFKFRIDPEAVTRNLKLEIPEIRRVNRRRDSEAPRTGLR